MGTKGNTVLIPVLPCTGSVTGLTTNPVQNTAIGTTKNSLRSISTRDENIHCGAPHAGCSSGCRLHTCDIVFKSRSPSVAWHSLDEHFSPKSSGSMFDILTEFNNERYNRGEDPDVYWIKLEKNKDQSTANWGRKCPRHGGNQVSLISPGRIHPCKK